MMNMQNLGSQESVGIKYVDGIYAEFCLKLWSESDCYFCNITELVLNAIQKQSSKQSLHKVSSEAALRRCSSK